MGRKLPPLSNYPEDQIIAEAFRIMRKRQKSAGPPKPKVLRPCPKCSVEFGARDMRKHISICKGKPK